MNDAPVADLLTRLRLQLEPNLYKVEHTPGEVLCRRPAPDKWNAFEHLCHIGRVHEVFANRITTSLETEEPEIGLYQAETDPQWPRYLKAMTVPELPTRLRALRNALLLDLEDLTQEQWYRLQYCEKFGPLPLYKALEHFLLHEAHHLYVVFQLIHMKDPRENG